MNITREVVRSAIFNQVADISNDKAAEAIDSAVIIELDDMMPCAFVGNDLLYKAHCALNGVPYIYIRDNERIPVARLYSVVFMC